MDRTSGSERRLDERHDRIRRRHVFWNKTARRYKPRDGWICNISRGGIALLVRSGSRPRIGDLFMVSRDGQELLCTVVSRREIEQKASVIRCRTELLARHLPGPQNN